MSARETPERLKEWAEKALDRHEEFSAWGESLGTCSQHCDPWPCDAYRAASMVLRVQEIHKQAVPWQDCAGCERHWPCPTIQSLCDELGQEGKW